jgi:acetoin utilization deacetylase AcuC-like enzyme
MAHGAMYAAAKSAIQNGVAFSPVSGFHHAGYDYNGGFCTFNGLMTTIAKLREVDGFMGSILILDFDGHWGDGTADILAHRLAPQGITHMGRGNPFKKALRAIKEALEAIYSLKPGLVLYQAGADSLRSDPFGAGYFTAEEWRLRDTAIFMACKELSIPIVWNLAGGYDDKNTIMAHASTFETAVRIFEEPAHPENTQSPVGVPDSPAPPLTGHPSP